MSRIEPMVSTNCVSRHLRQETEIFDVTISTKAKCLFDLIIDMAEVLLLRGIQDGSETDFNC
jgi:hypothetical protein